MRRERERGQTSAEYLGVLTIIASMMLALAGGQVAQAVAIAMQQALCLVGPTLVCPASDVPRLAELRDAEQDLAPFAAAQGGTVRGLFEQARQATRLGDYDTAERTYERLRLYRDLLAGGRGELVADLVNPSDAAFDDLIGQGTIYGPDDLTNRAYFRVEPAPGDGIIVMDYFIRQSNSVGLKGDDRDFEDPIRGDLDLTDSRITIVIDRESGRGMVTQSQTCTVSVFGKEFCNEPRPIALDGTAWVNDSEHDITGEGINIDQTNQFEFSADGDSVRLTYDALNSITPLAISVDGTVELTRDAGGRYRMTTDERDNYPAIGIWQYRPNGETHVVDTDPGESVLGALPHCDLPDLPKLPFGGPDLPDLPSIPGPCF